MLFLLFQRLILRPLWKESIRTALTIVAIALGVGVVVAIDLAGQAAAGSFHSSLESLTGKADLLITGTGGIDESTLGMLAQLPYPLEIAPRIEDFASMNGKGEAIPFIGIDVIGHGGSAGSQEVMLSGATQNDGDVIWVGHRLGLHARDKVKLLINDALQSFTVAGVIPSSGELGEDNIIVADIGLAQEVTGKVGRLDSITVRVPSNSSTNYWQSIIKKHLPASVMVEPQGSYTEENRKMLSAFRWNLRVLSYIALLVGGFLIYNTIAISVVRRRSDIGVIRALGATRAIIAAGFLSEAFFLAATGTLVGILLGRVMALGAVQLIGSTVQALYVSSIPAPVHLTMSATLTGAMLGIGISLLAALVPAWEASLVSPVEAMARGREQYIAALRSRRMIPWIIAALLLGGVFTQFGPVQGKPIFAYISVLLLIAGTCLLIPVSIAFFAAVSHRVIQATFGVEALLALRALRASIARTSILTAALATAIAMTASVGIMVGSFRETVWLWMDNQLKADFYLRPAVSSSADRYPIMKADIGDQIEKLDGVASVDRFRGYLITYEGLPATLASSETYRAENSASTRFLPGQDRNKILATLPTGDYAIVSEPFANKHKIHVGGLLSLSLGGAMRKFKVLGVYYDYSAERGYVVLGRRTLLKYLPDPAASNLAVYVKTNANTEDVRKKIDKVISGRAVLIFSNSNLRRTAIQIFDRTFRITYALEAVAVFVAVMGIAGALLAMVLDRQREFALLRFLGAAPQQIRKIILCEAGLLGLLANAIGILLGTVLSLVLIFVINKQSFGWTIQFHWPIALLLITQTGIYAATLLAGLYPARSATQLNPIEVIHEG